MTATAVTAEYNPFHNGHRHHINASKSKTNADYIITVMSGNFVQRGEPAILDKWKRTELALKNGSDMVLELPAFFSCASAEYFAFGAVSIMKKSNIVDFISFGSETDDISMLWEFSKAIADEENGFGTVLSQYLSKGMGFPLARENALKKLGINIPVLSANNILATEYMKALIKFNSNIKPVCVKRTDNGYNSLNPTDKFASATNIRKLLFDTPTGIKPFVPENAYDLIFKEISKNNIVTLNDMSHILNYILRTKSAEELSEILDVREGIENKFLKAVQTLYNFDDIAMYAKSKRYSYTGIQRMLLHIILGIKSEDMAYYKNNGFCPYIRVLGFKKSAVSLLKELTEKSSVPVVINVKKDESKLNEKAKFIFDFEKQADDIYYMCQKNPLNRFPNRDYTHPPVII